MKFLTLTIIILLVFILNTFTKVKAESIAWQNLSGNYDNFYEIQPVIVNEGSIPIFFDAYYSPFIGFEFFDVKSKVWRQSNVWHCGTGYKPQIVKVNRAKNVRILIDTESWNEITTKDSIGMPKFKQDPEYDGTGTYRFYFRYGTVKSEAKKLISYSPEFKVIEKDFKK